MSIHSIYEKKVLPNGLTLILVPVTGASSVTMSIFTKAGSRYEEARHNGISHFLEHLHFKGSKNYPSAKKLSEAVDAVGGEFNANTGKEHTQYYIRSAYEHLDLVMDVLTDMIKRPIFDEKEIEREKGVIIEEINMYRDNAPVLAESMFENLMWPDCSLGRDIAGTPEVIRSIAKKDILDYRDRFYQPGNMIVAISGHFDQDKFEKYINKHWAIIPSRKFGIPKPVKYRQNKPRLAVKTKNIEQSHVALGFAGYPYRHKRNPALRLLSAVLGGGMSSRLFLRIRERMGLAYYITASYNNYMDAGNFLVQAGLKVDSAPKAVEIIISELKKIRNDVTAGELKKSKEYIKGRIALAMEDPHDKLEWYLGQEAFVGRIRTIKQTFEELDKVTLDEVKKVANDIFRKETMNLSVVTPKDEKAKFEKKLTL